MKLKTVRIDCADFCIPGLDLADDWIEIVPLGCLPNADYETVLDIQRDLEEAGRALVRANDAEGRMAAQARQDEVGERLIQVVAEKVVQDWSFDVPLPTEDTMWQDELPSVLVESLGKLFFYYKTGAEPVIPVGVDEAEFLIAWQKKHTQEHLKKKGGRHSKSRRR